MSFYGNSYQYLAETFAHIILKNMGINNVSFPQPETDQIDISAEQADSGVNIFSGNHWIILNPIYDVENKNTPCGLQIWHNSPITSGTLNSAVPEVLDTVDDTIKKEAPLLGFDSCIKLPIITYDPAGHCLAKDEAIYFKMPVNPTGEIRKEVNEFKAVFEKGMSDMTKYVDDAEGRVNTINDNLTTKLKDLDEAIERSKAASDTANLAMDVANSAETVAGNAMTNANGALSNVSIYGTSIASLQEDIKEIKEKLGM